MQKANLEAAKPNAEAVKPNTENAKINSEPKPSTEATKPNTEAAKPTAEASKAPPSSKPAKEPAAKDGPVYQVFMPPLSYDANAKVQPDNFDPQLIVLVRRVRVRPTLIFQGTVKDAPAPATKTAPAAPPKTPEAPAPQKPQTPPKTPQPTPTIIERIRAFFRNLFS
jgi:hypothetical protein